MEEQAQDLTRIKGIIKRRKWWLIWPFVATVALAAIICMILPNMYKSTATILIKNQQIPPTLVPSTVTSYAEQRIQTITQEVMSRAKILKLIEKYNLLPNDRDKLTTEEMVEKIRDRITLEPINAEINKETSSRPVLLTIAFTVSYEDEDPKKAQLVTNEISSYYMEKNLESREAHARGTTKFLEEQLKQVKDQVDKLETKLAEYRKAHLEELPEFTNLNMQKLEKLNSDISNINMQIRSLEEQRATLRNKLASIDPYSGASDRVLSPEERLQQAKLERAQLLSKYSPKHPVVLAKNREIALLEKQVGEVNKIGYLKEQLHELELKLADLKSRYSDKHPSVKAVKREIAQVKKEIRTLKTKGGSSATRRVTDATNPAYIALKSDLDKINVSVASLKAEKKRMEKQIG
ncbi:MAG: lipopolysaccharide biosynthesis protein, partial [Deltaproteobacteria bacterium]